MTLITEVANLLEDVFTDVNAEGINPAGRFTVSLNVYDYVGRDKSKGRPGVETINEGLSQTLVPIDLQIKEVTRFLNNAQQIVGDAVLEISQAKVTRDQLLGKTLTVNQKVFVLINGDRYTANPGYLVDEDGFTWKVVLNKVKT